MVINVSNSLEVPKTPMNISTFNVVFFGVGSILVPSLEKLRCILKDAEGEYEGLA